MSKKGRATSIGVPRWLLWFLLSVALLCSLACSKKNVLDEEWETVQISPPITVNESEDKYLAFKSITNHKITPEWESYLVMYQGGLEIRNLPVEWCWAEPIFEEKALISCPENGIKIVDQRELIEGFIDQKLGDLFTFSDKEFSTIPQVNIAMGTFSSPNFWVWQKASRWGTVINGSWVFVEDGNYITWKGALGKEFRILSVSFPPHPLALLTYTSSGEIFLWRESELPQKVASFQAPGHTLIEGTFNQHKGLFVWAQIRSPANRTPKVLRSVSLEGRVTDLEIPKDYARLSFFDRQFRLDPSFEFTGKVLAENPTNNEVVVSLGRSGAGNMGWVYAEIWRAEVTATEISPIENLKNSDWATNVGYFDSGKIFWLEASKEGWILQTRKAWKPKPSQ